MRAPLSWIREFAKLPPQVTGRELAEVLVRQGLEVETVHTVGAGTTGPLVVGRVVEIETLDGFRKPIRYCQVDVGEELGGERAEEHAGERAEEHAAERAGEHAGSRGIVCGATNFAVGDLVVVALPGATLPGGFAISARQTYGRTSHGMICSERELGLGQDGSGIMVLPQGVATGLAQPGADAIEVLGIGEEVLDIAVTPDRGYALSIRGIAREAAIGFDCEFTDPGLLESLPGDPLPAPTADRGLVECGSSDAGACRLITMRTLSGFDASAPSPLWLRNRLQAAGMRSISVLVDVTNYVMLETGQPLHAFDADQVSGRLQARWARSGELLTTLDGVVRELDTEDLVIADDVRPLALAGTMGGSFAEITTASTTLALEAANFDAVTVGRMSRRHKLSTEASRRFERGVDPLLAPVASTRAAALILKLAGGTHRGMTGWEAPLGEHQIELGVDEAARVSGLNVGVDDVVRHLVAVGCLVSRTAPPPYDTTELPTEPPTDLPGPDTLAVTAPSWRPDLRAPVDLVEEVLRLAGYDRIPSTLPFVAAGRGLTSEQRLRRRVSRAAASFGLTEVLSYPFVGAGDFDRLGLAEDDPRRRIIRLANPLSDERPGMRTTMLPGLLATAARNVSRGADGVAIFEIGSVFVGACAPAPRLTVSKRPAPDELAELGDALPAQPRRLGAVIGGSWEPPGWWGPGRDAGWPDVIEAARQLAASVGAQLEVQQVEQVDHDGSPTQTAPYHPGRCAELIIRSQDGTGDGPGSGSDCDVVIGHAGELLPKVAAQFDLPARTAILELDLDQLIAAANDVAPAPVVNTMPVAKEDLALVVAESVPVAAVAAALRSGAGPLLESVRLFDVYRGQQVAVDHKSLAFALRFRAADHTLSADEVAAARAGALAAAADQTGAALRG